MFGGRGKGLSVPFPPPPNPHPQSLRGKEMNGTKFSLVDLGKLSKPISKLIDAVSQGIAPYTNQQKFYAKPKPKQILSLIRAEADIKKQELLKRAVNRIGISGDTQARKY